jgi:hypothetical protein
MLMTIADFYRQKFFRRKILNFIYGEVIEEKSEMDAERDRFFDFLWLFKAMRGDCATTDDSATIVQQKP